jgi:D-serine deaminase-like pyridoxal phosphate-dependent protein
MDRNAVLIDAGGIALSKDRSTQAAPKDFGFGIMLDRQGKWSFGEAIVARTHQEHGEVRGDGPLPFAELPVGALVRVAPNHTCLTVAAHDLYYVVDGGDEVIAVWDRVNGW